MLSIFIYYVQLFLNKKEPISGPLRQTLIEL